MRLTEEDYANIRRRARVAELCHRHSDDELDAITPEPETLARMAELQKEGKLAVREPKGENKPKATDGAIADSERLVRLAGLTRFRLMIESQNHLTDVFG